MMKRSLAVLAFAAAVLPATASAQAQELCGGPRAGPPATVDPHVCVTALFTLTNTNQLNVFIYNGSGGQGAANQSILSQFAIGGLPDAGKWSLADSYYNDWNSVTSHLDNDGTVALAGEPAWVDPDASFSDLSFTFQTGAGADGGSGGITPCAGPDKGVGDAHNPQFETCEGNGTSFGSHDDWVELSFLDSVGGLSQTTLDDLTWAFKVQGVSALSGNSFECNEIVGSDKFCEEDDISIPQGGDVVPEPGTMSLLAFGLTGMAAAGARRRRRKSA